MEDMEKEIEKTVEETEESVEKPSTGRRIFKAVLPYVIIVLSAILIRVIFLINANVPTGSMNDTIPTQSRVLGTKFAYWFSEPERGDIIVFPAPDTPEKLLIKRVIGVGGDVVEIKPEPNIDGDTSNALYVNGVKQHESYLREQRWFGGEGVYEVPEGCVFCMGDNRNDSLDARYWNDKYVSYDKIEGKAYLLYWPLSNLRWMY